MELLTRYAESALARGLIDEWHVWLFARNDVDRLWLRRRFPVVQATPNNSMEYFALPGALSLGSGDIRFRFQVRAANDVHFGLKRLSGVGKSYEIVLGGWGNQISALRKFDDGALLADSALRDPRQGADVAVHSPGILPEFGFSTVDVQVGKDGVFVWLNAQLVLRDSDPVAEGDFARLYRTGYGANGDWRFSEFDDNRKRLFITGPEPYFPASSMFYNQAYQYYAANAGFYRNDVILKCDDDIVYFDLDRLGEFVTFRRMHPEYFLVSANVVNNGVCAHFQQSLGAIPTDLMTCELPPGGMCGSLWSEGARAQALHRLFLDRRELFRAGPAPIVWNERISINFVALLGSDLVHIPDVSPDDEHDLCHGVRRRARKQNCIYPPFVAAHLSFWKQDADMDVASVLRGYEALAQTQCVGDIPSIDAAA